MKRKRLDILCVEKGLCPTRQRAQALILAGRVYVEGHPQTKAGSPIGPEANIEIKGDQNPYVSRGGQKLAAALAHYQQDVKDVIALDVGASTGGFTDCLLQAGAKHVIAVDVGYGQLDWKLRNDERVTCLERVNARHLEANELKEKVTTELWPPTLATIDVSFISLTLVLPALLKILAPGSPVLALVKPQFEAGRGEVGKGGVIRDPEVRQRAIDKVLSWAKEAGCQVDQGIDSPVVGPKGNVEFLVRFHSPAVQALPEGIAE